MGKHLASSKASKKVVLLHSYFVCYCVFEIDAGYVVQAGPTYDLSLVSEVLGFAGLVLSP